MNYRVADSIPNRRQDTWYRDDTFTKRSLWCRVSWQQVGMFIVLGFLLAITVLICTKSNSPLVPILFGAGLIVVTYAILRPAFALLLVFAAAGVPTLIVPIAFHTMRPIESTLELCVLIVFLRRPTMHLRLPHLLALLFIGIGLISFLHVPSIATSAAAYAADKEFYLLALFILALFVGTFLVDAIRNISSFLVAVLLCNIPLYLTGLLQALNIHALSFLQDSDAQSQLQLGGRLLGPFPGPATFGLYLMGLLAIALACWLLGTCRRDRLIGAAMVVVTSLEIVGSGTRSATAAAVVMVIVALVVTRRFKLLLGIVMFVGIASVILLGKILPQFAHPENSTLSRLFVWQIGLQLIASHPWLGIGLEQFPVYYAQLLVPRATQLDPNGISVHNQYIAWGLSSGILWPIVGTALLICIIYFCAKAYRNAQRGQQALLLAVILLVLGTLISGFVDVPLEKTEEAVFLFLLAGLALGHVERILWGKSTKYRATTFISIVSPVQALSPTGVENTLYNPIAARLRRQERFSPSMVRTATDGELDSQDEAPSVQKAGRSVILQLVSWGISAAIILPATALMTRYLGPVQYGEYSFTIPFLTIFAVFSGTGMDPLVTRTLSTQSRSKWSETLSFAAGTRLLSTLVVSGSAALIAFVLPVNAEQRILLLLGSGCLLFSFSFNGLRTVYECGFWAEQRFAIPSLVEAVDRVVTSGLIVVAILFHLSLVWTYILIVYSDLPFFLLLVFFAKRRFSMKVRFSLTRIRENLIGSVSLTIHNALTMLVGQVNLLLLLPLAGSFSVGLYGLALRITTPLQTIAVMYVIGIYPLFCKQFSEGRKQFTIMYSEAARILALAVIPLAIIVNVEARDIVLLLGGVRFIGATYATQILVLAVIVTFFGQLSIRSCMAAHLEHSIPYVTGVSLIVNGVASFLLIPHLQAGGAAIAALICQSTAFLLFTILLARHVNLLPAALLVLRVVLGNLPALAFLYWQPHLSLWLRIPVFLLLVTGGCIVTRTLSLKDVVMVRNILFTRNNKTSRGKGVTVDQPSLPASSMDDIAD